MGFPERLKQLRKEKGLSQIMLAKELGVSGGTVAMWETGKRKPQFEMFDKLCTFFDRSMDYILGASDDDRSFAIPERVIEPEVYNEIKAILLSGTMPEEISN